MAESLHSREEEILVLKSYSEAVRSQLAMTEQVVVVSSDSERAHQEQVAPSGSDSPNGSDSFYDSGSDSSNDSDSVLDPDMVRSVTAAFQGYRRAVEIFGNYVHKKWAERTGRSYWRIETLEELLKNFGISEGAHASFKLDFSSIKYLVWDHWVSSVMFNGFEDPLFGLEDVMAQGMVESRTLTYDCNIRFERFCDKKYVEVFPR